MYDNQRKDEADAEAVPLEMANLAGVFYVLLIGSVIAVIYGAMCLIWEIHIDAKRRKVREPYCCSHQYAPRNPTKNIPKFRFHFQAIFLVVSF